MPYKMLSKVYYQDKSDYESLYKQRINGENTKILSVKIHENEAFYCLCQDVFDLCLKIMELDKKVQVLKESLPGVAIQQFAEKCLIDEIMLSNDIEGVYSTRKEIKIIVDESNEKEKKVDRRFYGLVTKYLMLGRDKLSLDTCQDIRDIYNELVLPEVLEENLGNAPDGKMFRKEMAEVTTSTQTVIHRGVYPESRIIDYMDGALAILKNEQIPILVRISIFHYLFGYIHPFYDGNGRTSRFISSYLLSENLDSLIGYRLSYTIKENISDYYEAFKLCNDTKNRGDLTPFVITFLKIISKAYEKLYEALYDRNDWLSKAMKQILHIDILSTEEMFTMCEYLVQAALFSKEGISRKDLCDLLGVSDTTLRKRLSLVKENNYLIEKRIGQFKYYMFNVKQLG